MWPSVNNIKVMSKAIVCAESTLIGDVTIMPGCVIHASATIIAEAGPLILGENCLVEEYATIIHRSQPDRAPNDSAPTLVIGPNNVFEVGCTVEALKIGERNLFECKSFVGPSVSVTNGCVIGAGVSIRYKQVLAENTVIYGNANKQREAVDKQMTHISQSDFLRKVLPNYHHVIKPDFDIKKLRKKISE